MGVDSGLPDFRGNDGFWHAYPALGKAGISFYDIANPQAFQFNPERAWGFYGHRLNLYRETTPHEGFDILMQIGKNKLAGTFVYTSNVDCHFQKVGFTSDQILECHGSIHQLQCLEGCSRDIWSADEFKPEVDLDNCRLTSELPTCPHCGALARPNILMFGDWGWIDRRANLQAEAFVKWRRGVDKLVAIEIGAGTTIPSVRDFCSTLTCPVIRINIREPALGSTSGVSIPAGGLQSLKGIAKVLGFINKY